MQGEADPRLLRGILGERRQLLEVQSEPRERPDQIGAALARARLQRVGMRDVALCEMLVIFGRADVQSPVRDNATLIQRVFVGVGQRHELVVAVAVGDSRIRRPSGLSPAPGRAPVSKPRSTPASSRFRGAL